MLIQRNHLDDFQKISPSDFETESLAYYRKLGTRNKQKMDIKTYRLHCAQSMQENFKKLNNATTTQERRKYESIMNALGQRYKSRIEEEILANDETI